VTVGYLPAIVYPDTEELQPVLRNPHPLRHIRTNPINGTRNPPERGNHEVGWFVEVEAREKLAQVHCERFREDTSAPVPLGD